MDEKEREFNEMMDRQREMQNDAILKGQTNPSATPPLSGSTINPDEQKILNEVRENINAAPVVTPTQGQCPECNLFHPPLAPGQKCPNAPVKAEGISDIQINTIVVKVKDILASQLEQKSVKDLDKFVGGMIVALMQYCEGYKE